MEHHKKNHSLWRYALAAFILLNGNLHNLAAAAQPNFWAAALDVAEKVIIKTEKGIAWGINKLTEDKTEGAEKLYHQAIERYQQNIAALQSWQTQMTGGYNPTYTADLTLMSLCPSTTLASHTAITAQKASSDKRLFLSLDTKDYFINGSQHAPQFSQDSVALSSSSDTGSVRKLIDDFEKQICMIKKALLKRSLQKTGLGKGEIIKAMIEQQGQVKAAKESALISAATAADQSEKNLKTILSFAHNPRTAAILLATFGGGVALYHLLPRLIAPKPQIVSEMSFLTPYEKLMGKKLPASNFEQIVFTAETGPQVMRAVTHMRRVIHSGGELMNLIFFGPPGTGKTMSAKAIARSVGADYMLINASAFEQLTPGQAVSELEATFRLARKNKKPVIIFFDEADSIMGRRGGGMETLTSRRVINTFLANVTDTHNNKIMFILATNIPGSLDPAVLSRFPEEGWIFFDRPSQSERARILRMYLESFAAKENVTLDESAKENMESYATLLKGKTGRDLRAIARSITDSMVDEGNKEITDPIIRQRLQDIEQNKKNMEAYQYGTPTIATT